MLADDGTVERIQEVESLPRAGAWVYEAGADLTAQALGLDPDPAKALEIGVIHGSKIPVHVNRSVVQRHMFICGGIGSGKSYTRGVLAEELISMGFPK